MSNSPPLSDAANSGANVNPFPKHPSFFRLLARSAGNNKQGLAVVALATSCLFLSMSMLDHKRRFDQLQEHYLSLKAENKELRNTLDSLNEVAFQDPAARSPAPPSDAAVSQSEGTGFMV